MQTSGSSGLRTSVTLMQQAGASARERLRVAAAQRWNVDPADCTIGSGRCLHKATNRTLDYGTLAPAAAAVKLPTEPAIKAPKDFKLVGKWTPRLDTAPKLDGSAKYGIDADVPGMVYAAVLASPVVGGKLRAVDESGLKGLRGISSTVKLPDAVVVVADRYWRAKSGLDALKIDWDDGGYGAVSTEGLRADYLAALESKPMFVAAKKGDPTAALGQADIKVVEATYEAPFLAHAPMEPLNCTVSIQAERADVWISTQAPMRVLATVAKETGLRAGGRAYPQSVPWGRIRASGRGQSRRAGPGDCCRQGDRQTGQAHLVTRDGYPPRPVPAAGLRQVPGRARSVRQSDSARHPALRSLAAPHRRGGAGGERTHGRGMHCGQPL